ncbi:MAG: DNA gyrase subunit A [Candidatus Liptonbacteria bacterium]|nr:DNA gyrase subunit A [Candidatus Liptonbacteria bacterium]
MAEEKKNIQEREIAQELQESYLDYAMSVIVSRALPDVRDGLKPVHRRILWAMWDGGYSADAKTKKSANIVGEVMGKYHPHGDIAIYDTLVRMAQDFSMRYPLIQGQGNFGSIDGDSAAAMRYTEAKLSKIAEELLLDIEKETVNWTPNYDAMREEPKVLPAKLPNLLLNGSEGIAVGMTTKIPPHHLGEVVDATVHLLEHPKASADELVEFVKGPDFPTGGIIYDKRAITEVYATGKGPITMRAVAEIVPRKTSGKEQFDIVITEIPYQVNKSELITTIALLVTEKKIEGIKDIRDESDRRVRIIIELKSDVPPQKVLNQLYNRTDLQRDFHVNMLALEDGGIQPRVMSLKDMLEAHIAHRREIVKRRAEFDLKKAKERAHILEGLAKALAVIDKIIATIKKSADKEDAHKNLVAHFKLTAIQANAILEMRLQTLAALERQKIEDELKEKKKLIEELELLVKSPAKITALIKKEFLELKEKYGDERRTKVVATGLTEFREEDLIPAEETIITLSKSGYIKRVPPATFKSQRRGGKGLIGSEVGEEDFLSHFVGANTHDNILFFTGRGRVFQTKVYEIPQGSRTSKGKAIHNFLEIPPEETANAIVSYPATLSKKEAGQFVAMVTEKGLVKRTPLKDFANVRRNGIIALNLKKGDSLRWVKLSSGSDEIIITTGLGQSIRFKETDARPMGRTAAGVSGIRLKGSDTVSSMDVVAKDKAKEGRLLVVMQNGFGKHTALSQYKVQKRGGSGIKTAEVTTKTGPVVSAHIVTTEEELFAISAKGQTIRTDLKTVRVAGRATQGVKIMTLNPGDKVAGTICL